ncbi:UDP-glucosyltransferase 2-like [Chironomus tepperi]|uniref:UDP-glucosyltransferase 2-like n=1 Tax=Chironomus tepperi TaxID=113505 RepID=UPI00391EFFE4
MKSQFLIIFIISLITFNVNSLNILFTSELASPSHHIFNSALARALAARGHNVTFLSADIVSNPPENLHYIHMEYQYNVFKDLLPDVDMGDFFKEFAKMGRFANMIMMSGFGYDVCKTIAKNKGFQVIMDYPSDFKFDLMIYDYTALPCLLGLLDKFNYPPLVGLTAFCNPPYTADIVGGDRLGLTLKPHYMMDYDKNMNIWQRLDNGFYNFIESLVRKYYSLPKIDKEMKEIFGPHLPYVHDLEKLMQIALVNSHPAIEFAESLPPNVIEIGGMQIADPKPVEKELDEFLNNGKKGSVLMSLGSNFKSEFLDESVIVSILEAFRQLPDYNFVWKFENSEKIKELPKNVMIRPWLSQNDILAHKNVKAFISHSGMLSTLESTWHGVPIVGIPLFMDQIRNLRKSENAGVAVKVDINTITTDQLKSALLEVLENPKYKANMKLRSELFKDQPEKPIDRAVWWCEYVMRNPKATHLKPVEFNFGLLGSHFWDIQLISIILLIFAFKVFRCTFRKVCCKVCSMFGKCKKTDDKTKKE